MLSFTMYNYFLIGIMLRILLKDYQLDSLCLLVKNDKNL